MAEHLSPAAAVAAGLRALPGHGTAFASTQAAWRFYANPLVSVSALATPLIDCARAMASELDRFALIVLDWSELTYAKHTTKRDRVPLNDFTLGDVLQTALMISDRDGMALAPVAMSLWTSDGIYSSRCDRRLPDATHLDDASDTMAAIDTLALGAPTVYIIDREGDSVRHYRRWADEGRRVVVRANDRPRVEYDGQTLPLRAVAEHVDVRPTDAVDLGPGVVGQQFIGETRVTVTRPAHHGRRSGGRRNQRQIAGAAVELRLIVSQIRGPDDALVARWLLLTNVEEQIEAPQIARWYLWRWRIEPYFKLMKSSGQQLEQWQQHTAETMLKRLLVASMAAVVIWQVARAEGGEAEAARTLLVRLSGRQMRRDRPSPAPAMLSGMWVLLSMLDALETYSVDELKRMARSITMGIVRYDSS